MWLIRVEASKGLAEAARPVAIMREARLPDITTCRAVSGSGEATAISQKKPWDVDMEDSDR